MNPSKPPLEEGKEAPLNFAWQFYIGLDESRTEAKRAYRANDIRAWWKGLNEVYSDAQILFSDDEKKEINDLLESSLKRLKLDRRDSTIADDLNKTYRRLMDIMHHHGMVFPNIKDQGINGYRKRLGLETK